MLLHPVRLPRGAAAPRTRPDRPDGASTRPAPPRSTPGSRTRRAGCSPTSCPRAATRSRVLRVMDVGHRAGRRRARSTAAATPRWPGCPAARRSTTCAGWPPSAVPDGEEQYHRRVYLHRVGTPADEDVLIFGEGREKTNYYGVSVSRDGRWLIGLGLGRHRAAQRPVAGRPGRVRRRPRPSCGWSRRASTRRPACASAATGGCTCSPTGTRRAAGSRRRPGRPGPGGLARPARPRTPEAVLATSRSSTAPSCPAAPAGRRGHATRSARSPCTTWPPASGRATVPLPGLGSIGGISERPEGGHEAWFGYTDYVTPAERAALRRAAPAQVTAWARAPGAVDVPPVRAEPGRPTRPRTAPRSGCWSSRRRARRDAPDGPARRDGPADHPVRVRRLRGQPDARLLRVHPGLGRGRRGLRDRRAARRRRGGRGLAPRRACGSASRTSSTTSTRRPRS